LRTLKPSGNFLKKNATRNFVLGMLSLAFFLALFITSIQGLPFYVNTARYDTARGITVGLMVACCYYFLSQGQNFRKGTIGERRVAETLSAALNDEYSLFNDVKLSGIAGGNIDHVLVGPTGIFVMETKNIQGKISCYGDNWEGVGRNSPSGQARINAMKIRKLLTGSAEPLSRPLWIQGVVVFTNNKAEITMRKPPEHVKVAKIGELADYIKGEPRRFEAKQIGRIETEILDKIKMNE
jgi:hypothetical protein